MYSLAGLFTLCEHYLSTPVKSVLEGVEELKASSADPAALTKVETGGQQVASLVAGMLDTELVLSDGLAVKRSLFNVADVTETAVEAMDEAAEAVGLEMIIDAAPDAPAFVLADSKRTMQVRVHGA